MVISFGIRVYNLLFWYLVQRNGPKLIASIYSQTQFWMLSRDGEIRRDEACLDYSGSDVVLFPCHGSKGNQYWTYNAKTKQLRHGSSEKCLAINSAKNKPIMEECDSHKERQRWQLENYDPSKGH